MNANRKLDQLISNLGADDWNAVQSSIDQLVDMGEVAIPHLLKEVETSTPSTTYAISTLGYLQAAEAIIPISRYLSDEDVARREAAVLALSNLPDFQDWNKIIEMLTTDPSTDVRQAIAYALGRKQDKNFLEVLIRLLTDSSSAVVESASEALISYGNDCIDILLMNMDSNDQKLHDEVMITLNLIVDRIIAERPFPATVDRNFLLNRLLKFKEQPSSSKTQEFTEWAIKEIRE